MRITSKIFESSDLETKKTLLHNTQVYHQIGELYEKFVFEFSNKRIWFLTNRMKDDTLRKKYKQCGQLVDIALELNVPFDVYIKVQFEILTPFLKKQNLHPQFVHLISPRAVERFKSHIPKLKERFTGTSWMDRYTKGSFVDVRKSVVDSAERFYERLKIVKCSSGDSFNVFIVLKEFERMARAGILSNVYVWSSPLQCDIEFIKTLQEKTAAKMTDNQKFLAKKARTGFVFGSGDKELIKYV